MPQALTGLRTSGAYCSETFDALTDLLVNPIPPDWFIPRPASERCAVVEGSLPVLIPHAILMPVEHLFCSARVGVTREDDSALVGPREMLARVVALLLIHI
eukprot:TRINITY_DN20512_c0_g2_i1.p2 TRINITY_DN20512_c0_g2~~TRINITY_DN20512_c0_g2_i1.p2  ORF type:complete len:101 (-),score=20.46 TRINITY_DN20512_c0_g2_i1:178-480(-)